MPQKENECHAHNYLKPPFYALTYRVMEQQTGTQRKRRTRDNKEAQICGEYSRRPK